MLSFQLQYMHSATCRTLGVALHRWLPSWRGMCWMPVVHKRRRALCDAFLLSAGIIVCFYSFDLPQFRGVRMAAVVVLFLCFGAASLPLTYLLSFGFSDEMRGLQVQCCRLTDTLPTLQELQQRSL
jgi:hypothetical protein